jgi:hypothetical protein
VILRTKQGRGCCENDFYTARGAGCLRTAVRQGLQDPRGLAVVALGLRQLLRQEVHALPGLHLAVAVGQRAVRSGRRGQGPPQSAAGAGGDSVAMRSGLIFGQGSTSALRRRPDQVWSIKAGTSDRPRSRSGRPSSRMPSGPRGRRRCAGRHPPRPSRLSAAALRGRS